jgi:cellulose synthase/poly-beta-1,6-N-acetylglucosamine synthase-like glycosyltransferase
VVKVVVAIPVRDEAERIETCLAALNIQSRRPDTVVLMLNNCTDATEALVHAMAPRLRFALDVVGRDLPAMLASAGHARRLAFELAARRTGYDDVLMTTDADAVASPDWVARNLTGLQKGVEVVCGRTLIDPVESTVIPAHLHTDDALECRLLALLDRLAWTLDPESHDPLPRHTEASGASLAVRTDTFRRVGGIPAIRSGEDRAFVRALWLMDARIRHDPSIEVIVSGRVIGRAKGGMADAIRRRMIRQDEFTDEQVEPAADAFRRYGLRCRARCAWVGSADTALASDLLLAPARLDASLSQRWFGAAWAALEAYSPVLRRQRVRFIDLPGEIAAAEALLHEAASPEILAAD